MGVRAAMDSAAYLYLSLLYLEGEHFPFPVRPPGSLKRRCLGTAFKRGRGEGECVCSLLI